MFSDFLKPYEELEPMPEVPKQPSWRPVWVSWVILAIVTALLTDSTHAIISLVWIPWIFLAPGYRVHRYTKLTRQFHRDLDDWSARADAHHQRVMQQIQQYANRDWN